MVKDEQRDIKVTFPESYHSTDVAGKDAVFKVYLHEIKRKVLPELDDEFAKDVSEFDTLEEYKSHLKEKLLKTKAERAERDLENLVIEKVAGNASLEIPQVMIDQEIEYMFKDFEKRLGTQGLNLDLYFQFTGQDEASLKEQMQDNAEKAVRNRLVLEQVSKAEQLTAEPSDIEDELKRLSEQYKHSVEEIKEAFEKNGSMSSFANDIVISKTIKFLIDNNKPKKSRKKAASSN
jgi:trigger factor